MNLQGSNTENNNVSHKLLITLSYHPDFRSSYVGLLSDSEFPRGVHIPFRLNVTNLSDHGFPGGVLEELSLAFGLSSIGATITSFIPKVPIDPLPPSEARDIHEWESIMYCEGLLRVQCRISSNDDKQVEHYYRTKNDKSAKPADHWNVALYVVNRENLEIIKILKSLEKKLQ